MRGWFQWALQYARFGTVGLVATVSHVLMFTAWIELADLAPLAANLFAFGTAVLISFLGHFYWTFRNQTEGDRGRRRRLALLRFTIVALLGLALNSFVVYLIVNLMLLPYQYAMVVMVGLVPLIVFALSKFWAFA